MLFLAETKWNISNIPLREGNPHSNVQVAMQRSLYNKYSYSQNHYYAHDVIMILEQHGRPFVTYKDKQILDEKVEHLQEVYTKEESEVGLKAMAHYYRYHWLVPRFYISDLKLNHVIDKFYTKRKAIHYQRTVKLLEKQQNRLKKQPQRQNLANLLSRNLAVIQKKLNSYKPILQDITFIRLQNEGKTTEVILELVQNSLSTTGAPIDFLQELEEDVPRRFIEEQVKQVSFALHVNKSQSSSLQSSPKQSMVGTNLIESKIMIIQQKLSKKANLRIECEIQSFDINSFSTKKNDNSKKMPFQSLFGIKKHSAPQPQITQRKSPPVIVPPLRLNSKQVTITQSVLAPRISNRPTSQDQLTVKKTIKSESSQKLTFNVQKNINENKFNKENAWPKSKTKFTPSVKDGVLKSIYQNQNQGKRLQKCL